MKDWFKIYSRAKQFNRYYQSFFIFNNEYIGSGVNTVNYFLTKSDYTSGINHYSCTNKILSFYRSINSSRIINLNPFMSNINNQYVSFFRVNNKHNLYNSYLTRLAKIDSDVFTNDISTLSTNTKTPFTTLFHLNLAKIKIYYKILIHLTISNFKKMSNI